MFCYAMSGKMSSYIRPTLKSRRFTSGGPVNYIPTGTYGRVGEISSKLSNPMIYATPDKFRPLYDYKFFAKKMLQDDQQESYIKKCEEWLKAHPAKILAQNPEIQYDRETLSKFWTKKTSLPSLVERVAAFQASKMPEAIIEKHIKWDAMMDETSEKRQKDIDEIFGKYANSKADTKSKPKPKPKILKPVKKKMLE
jgi:hypothetical protein